MERYRSSTHEDRDPDVNRICSEDLLQQAMYARFFPKPVFPGKQTVAGPFAVHR